MSSQGVTFPDGMLLDLRLSARKEARLLKIAVRSLADAGKTPRPGARWRARDAIPVFVAAVDHGLFSGVQEREHASVLNATTSSNDKGERIDEWELMTPPLDVEALTVLGRMFWVAGARGLVMVQNAPEESLSVRAFDTSPGTERSPPWEVARPAEEDVKDAVLVVTFEQDAPPEVVRATQETVRAWAAVVASGGFAGPSTPASSAVLSEVGVELDNEVFATFEGFQARRDAWGALWVGLSRIHRYAPIRRVEMR